MGGVDEGTDTVEAEAEVLAPMIMRSIHVVAMVLEEETTATMIKAGDLEEKSSSPRWTK